MAFINKRREASERATERRRAEDAAPRLIADVPRLESLRLEIDERRADVVITHLRRVVVATAPALFALTCAQRDCTGGGHDITSEVMTALRRGEERFSGHRTCRGQIGPSDCGGTLDYVGIAVYRPA